MSDGEGKGARESFASRWARRKTDARLRDEDTAPATENEAAAADPPGLSEEELAALEAEDIEALDFNADFKRFLQDGVPDALKKRALRQLWRSNPVLANLDGMNDYDENFRATHKVLEAFTSAYQIGTGHLTKEERAIMAGEMPAPAVEDDAETDAEAEVHDEDVAGENTATAQAALEATGEGADAPASALAITEAPAPAAIDTGTPSAAPETEPDATRPARRRRMVFDVPDGAAG